MIIRFLSAPFPPQSFMKRTHTMITSLFAIVAFFQAARAYDLSIIGSTCESITYRMTLIPGEWTLGFSWNTQLFLDSGKLCQRLVYDSLLTSSTSRFICLFTGTKVLWR